MRKWLTRNAIVLTNTTTSRASCSHSTSSRYSSASARSSPVCLRCAAVSVPSCLASPVSIALFFQTLTAALMTYGSLPLSSLPFPSPTPQIVEIRETNSDYTHQQRSLRPRPQQLPLLRPHRLSRALQLRLHVGGRSLPLPLPRSCSAPAAPRPGTRIVRTAAVARADEASWDGGRRVRGVGEVSSIRRGRGGLVRIVIE